MKIAVTYEQGNVYQHFGHTEEFKIYEVEDNEVVSSEVIGTDGNGHEALAGYLRSGDVAVLICGGIGQGAINALGASNIKVVPGVSGDTNQAVEQFLAGTLKVNPVANCNHHGEGHSCHGHSEGHSCHSHN